MGSFYRIVCFFESAVCNGEGGRLKGFQLIQFHNVLSLLLILMLVTLMNDDADDGERYHLKSRQSRGDLAGECEKAMLSTFLRQSGHCFYFNLCIYFFKCNLCIFLLNQNFAHFLSSFFLSQQCRKFLQPYLLFVRRAVRVNGGGQKKTKYH